MKVNINGATAVQWDEDETTEPDNLRELAHRLPEQVSRLIHAEAELAKLELGQRARVLAVAGGTFGASAMLMFLALCSGVVAVGLGLANVMQPWLAAVVVAGGCVVLAGLIALPGWKGIRDRRSPVPVDSLESLKSDLNAVLEARHVNDDA